MSNIKWSGIEQWKYGLTARWYVSAYYGNDTDVDAVGLYNPSTNPTGHGGKESPFSSGDKAVQMISSGDVIVFDSGTYTMTGFTNINTSIVGDGNVIIYNSNFNFRSSIKLYKALIINTAFSRDIVPPVLSFEDCYIFFCNNVHTGGNQRWANNVFNSCTLRKTSATSQEGKIFINNVFVKCAGTIGGGGDSKIQFFYNNIIINSPNLVLSLDSERFVTGFCDFSVVIGTVQADIAINEKPIGEGLTISDFKAHGEYFVRSYSEVDLFGNASGNGATVSQLNEIFNNFYYPYIDDYHNLDLTLRPDCDERVRFGGLNGTYIGALPVGYRLSASELWNTHIDVVNTSNLAFDMVNNAIVLATGQDVGTYTSLIIDLGVPFTVDMVDFLANFVYNVEGTAKQGVSNQRIDTTPDLQPDNTKNQRVVYDYRLQYSPDAVTALTDWENLELNRMPTVDGAGLYQLEDGFDQSTAQKLTIQRLKIEFTLRRVIIA